MRIQVMLFLADIVFAVVGTYSGKVFSAGVFIVVVDALSSDVVFL